jgi:hypothetical protein
MCMKISITSFGDNTFDLVGTINRDSHNNSETDNILNEPYNTRGPI